jgi:hypothetical protein
MNKEKHDLDIEKVKKIISNLRFLLKSLDEQDNLEKKEYLLKHCITELHKHQKKLERI